MGGYPQVFESWGGALAAAITTSLGPGDTSAVYSRTLANDYGGAQSAGAMTGVRLVLEVKVAGVWVTSGHPLLDDKWASMRITSVEDDGDATFGPYSTGSRRIGTSADFEVPDIPEDCGLNFDIQFFAPSDITTAAVEWRLVPLWDQNAVGVGAKVGLVAGSAVVPGQRDAAIRRVVTGMEIVTSGTDVVIVERGQLDYDGVRAGRVRSSHTLNQNDVVPSALTAGQSYIAALTSSAAGVVTATKGTRATVPVAPALPANSIFLRYVTVVYEVGGTSIIDATDLSGTFIRGDYMVEAGSGLAVLIHSGRAIYDTSNFGFHDIRSTLAVTASITNYVWARPDGTFSASATEVAPITGAQLLAEADADGSAVTAVRDRRAYLSRAWSDIPLELGTPTVSATGTVIDWFVVPHDCEITRVRLEAGAVSGGASGSYVIDVNTAPEGEPKAGTWTTIYTGQGSDDRRPSIAWNATVLADKEEFHEVRRVRRGTRIGFDVDAIPAGGTATDMRVIVYLTPYR
jgi:hypothetical protein